MTPEKTLLERVREGLPHRRDIRRLVRNILRDEAAVDDVLQELHLALWLKVQHDLGEPIDDLKRWLITAARNRARDELRRRKSNDRMLQSLRQETGA